MSDESNIETRLRAVEPALYLISERHLLKVLTYLRDRDHAVPLNSRLPLWVERSRLAEIAVPIAEETADTDGRVLLVMDSTGCFVDHLPVEEQLWNYWRLLFQAAVVREIDRQIGHGLIDCGRQFAKLGAAAGREVVFVLESDHYVERVADDAARYRAFAALVLDLIHFAPEALRSFFPSLPPSEVVLALLAEHLEIDRLLQHSQPQGTVSPRSANAHPENLASEQVASEPTGPADVAETRNEERKGNYVRAAIRFTRSGQVEEAVASLDRLTIALGRAANWTDPERAAWKAALLPLLRSAASGEWPMAARCLYELQKIPDEAGRDIFAVDLVESIRTLGRRPIKRPLPHARFVILLMHLKAAIRQLLRSRLEPAAQLTLQHLMHGEIERTERRVRAEIGPVLAGALAAAGWMPNSCVETVARDKVVAELLDRICDRGIVRIGDLRDAIARNQLKMTDLAAPGEFFTGDLLLRADRQLTYDLDGVYHRGEFYLRGLQRLSSLFFGTHTGRLVFLYLILPFVAAFMTVVFTQEVIHLGGKVHGFSSKILKPRSAVRPAGSAESEAEAQQRIEADDVAVDEDTGDVVRIDTEDGLQVAKVAVSSSAATTHDKFSIPWEWVGPLTLVFLVLFHVPFARFLLLRLAVLIWRAVRFTVWEAPQVFWQSAPVKEIRHSALVRVLYHYLASAVVLTLLAIIGMALLGAPALRLFKWGGVVFAATVLLANTGWGWVVQERLSARLDDALRLLRVNLIPGFISWCIWAFRALANWIERQLYSVDEWLRFRGGDSSSAFVTKALLGLVWFPIEYVVRFAFYLLLEPQINPVKHFPVVTVSHKVLLPMFPTLAEVLSITEDTAFAIIFCVPGVFGFIAWELMANWKLYRANRTNRLRPVVIGSHGESMRGLLRPGFHSGTVPKLFKKLRQQCRRNDSSGAVRIEHELAHAAEGVHLFVERELLVLLERTGNWTLALDRSFAVTFGCQRVLVELPARELHVQPFAFALENRNGKIESSIVQDGWLDKLLDSQRRLFESALRGLFDMAAAELFEGEPREPMAEALLAKPWNWNEWVTAWESKS